MRNNDGTEEGLQQYLLNIVDDYQVSQVMYTNSSTPKIWFSPAISMGFFSHFLITFMSCAGYSSIVTWTR